MVLGHRSSRKTIPGYVQLMIIRACKLFKLSTVLISHHTLLYMPHIYGGWPSSITWWIVNGTCLGLMALLGEWYLSCYFYDRN
ncbi:hypothetical protein MKW94_027624, partial [Papaver nudicaule]|nr:hypothetical protein [Papaver nudicaule]